MQSTSSQLERIKLAARLYYVDGMSQKEVARMLDVSQAKISRLLNLAREQGIVQFMVKEYEPRNLQLEKKLRNSYSLEHVVVIRNSSHESTPAIRCNVGYFGSHCLAEMIQPGQVIGLTGGRTLAELVSQAKASQPLRDLRFVQLMGSIDANVNANDAVELSRHLAEIYEASFYTLNTPAFVSNASSREALLEQKQVQAVWNLYEKMDLALVGIGSLTNSAFIERGILSSDDLKQLCDIGAVGEICGRFYDNEGQECQSAHQDHVVSIQLDELRKVPHVVGVTVGEDRAEAVVAAVQSGLLKSLILDEKCARSILAIQSDKHSKKQNSLSTARST